MSTRTRTLVSTGIYRDKFGAAIVVSVIGKPREFRADEHKRKYKHFTDAELRTERKRVEARERLKTERRVLSGHALRADVTEYLKTLQGRTKDDAENLLAHWLTEFGDRHRSTLTAIELRQHAATWHCAASTFNHRRQALISLFRALDGRQAPNPAREIPKRRETMGAPKALSYTVIEAALKKLPATKSRARLKVMAYTGLPQMQIQKLTPEDWQSAQLRVTPRRKGSGVHGRWIPLSPQAKAALQEFSDVQAWGNFSRSSLHKAWQAVGPKGSNPYALRHSWITELYRRSNGDVLAVKQLALHSMLAQTERYAAAALDDRMKALVVPRKTATVDRGKRAKPSAFVRAKRRTRSTPKQGKKGQKTLNSTGK